MNIVVRAPNWVGDCVLALPFLRRLREKNPDAGICVLAKKPGIGVFEGNPHIDRLLTYEDLLRTAVKLCREDYDRGYILPNSFSSAFLFTVGGVRERVGYDTEARSFLLTRRLKWEGDSEPRAIRYVRLLDPGLEGGKVTPASHPAAIVLDGRCEDQAEELLRDLPRDRLVAINPCANALSRRWPAERYGSLAGKLVEEAQAYVVLVGGPAHDDRALAGAVLKSCGSPKVRDLSGKTTLKGLAAVLKRSRLLVTGDTGIMHVAAAVKTPILALEGAADVKVTGAWTEGPVRYLDKKVPCSPCVKNRCINKKTPMVCMETISVEDVLQAAREMLAEPAQS